MTFQRFLLAVGFVCIVASVLCAYFALPEPPDGLVAVEPIKDCGDLRQGQTVPGEFQLINYHRNSVEIVGITESCGCSTVGIDAKHLQPGHGPS